MDEGGAEAQSSLSTAIGGLETAFGLELGVYTELRRRIAYA